MEKEADAELEIVKSHANQLAEHFDSVQIFVTRHDGGRLDGTVNINYGAGNWFTRFGQISSWVVKSNERTCKEVREEAP